MYRQIKSCITVNGSTSGFFNCEKGVRQGKNISPLLFAIYLNDFEVLGVLTIVLVLMLIFKEKIL